MKKGLFFLVALFLLGLSGCEEKKPTEAKDFNNNLKDFNKSIHHVDKTMDIIDRMDSEIESVEKLKKDGKISSNEAEHRIDVIRTKYSQELVRTGNVTNTIVFPEWAKRIGLRQPENMSMNLKLSQITSANDSIAGYNSINFVYSGSYDVAMKQAKEIAAQAGIPIAKDFQEAADLAKELDTEPVKGVIYMNFEIGKEDTNRYHVAITVDDVGRLTITATDVIQLMNMEKSNKNP